MSFKNKKSIISFMLAAVIMLTVSLTACRPNNDTSSVVSAGSSNVSSAQNSSGEAVSSAESEVNKDNGIRLTVSSPVNTTVNVTAPDFTFSGGSDPAEALTVNGTAVERAEDGSFTYPVKLNVGKNTFSFAHKGETKLYTVNYRYIIIKSYSPSGTQSYPCGSTLVVNVTARNGSAVKASFNGQTIDLTRTNEKEDNTDFVGYNGVFHLPKDNVRDLDLGKITFKASHAGKSESFTSGKIICKKTDAVVNYDSNATPTGGKYINVGSGYIAEIVQYSAETFDGNVTDKSIKDGSVDWSRPTNNYLPKGTLDYCSTSVVSYKDLNYVTLRAGYRVYREHEDKPRKGKNAIVRQYIGSLPDHNEINIAAFENGDSHTVLTLDCLWKAPFYFDILPQKYTNPSVRDYTIGAVTYNYIDITFCYATELNGEIVIPEDNPLFKEAKIIQNKNADGSLTRDYTLRLFLKRQGAFYGWDSYYNSNNQLVFEFLNPKTVTAGDNEYGTDLSGAKILIDVGHGGIDGGAPGLNPKQHNEAAQNLYLAYKLKAELEKTGATVIMTRTDNSTSSSDDKIKMLKQLKPDYCIAIHHNSAAVFYANGYEAFYHHPFAKKAAEFVFAQTKSAGIYSKCEKFGHHYYFVARVSCCPVVLTENGFISNGNDYKGIISEETNIKKAKAITRGIVDYFNSIQ